MHKKEPNLKYIEHFKNWNLSEEQLKGKIDKLFTLPYQSDLILGLYDTRIFDGYSQETIRYLLNNLPKNHIIVKEILNKTNDILGSLSEMSLQDLIIEHKNIDNKIDPITKHSISCEHYAIHPFFIGNLYAPKEIFYNLEKASYHIIKNHLSDQIKLPIGTFVYHSIMGMIGYDKNKKQRCLKFAEFLDDHKIHGAEAYLLNLYAKLGDERAIIKFIQYLKEGDNNLGYDFLAKHIKSILIKNHKFSEHDIKKHIDKIEDLNLKEKVKDYFDII